MPLNEEDLWRFVKEDRSFKVLIWGPGEKHPDYAIRTEVRKTLRRFFANVNYSEDFEPEELSPAAPGRLWLSSIALRERLHGADADAVLVLATSPGAKLEVILFWRMPTIGPKMHVLAIEQTSDDTFIDRVVNDILNNMPRHQVHRFPKADFTPEAVAAHCEDYIKGLYMGKNPAGPPAMLF